jgi:SAM-dependent methyltransferase
MAKKKKEIKPIELKTELPLPYKDESQLNVVLMNQYHKLDDPIDFLNEVWRILKPGGVIQIATPYFSSSKAWFDPETKRAVGEGTFYFFNKKWREGNKANNPRIKTDFIVEKIDHAVSQEFVGKSQDTVQYALAHFWNVASDILVMLRKPKP